MGFMAEAIAKLKLDTTEFERDLTRTVANVGRAGEDMGKKLRRSFGAGDVFKGLLQGLGLASVERAVETIARLWSGVTEEAEANYKKMAELSEENTRSTIANMRKLADEETRYQLLLKDRARALNNPQEGFTPRPEGMVEGAYRTLANNRYVGHLFKPAADKLTANRVAENEAGRRAAEEAAKKRATDADSEVKEIEKQRKEREKKATDDKSKAFEQEAKDRAELAEMEEENRRSQLTLEQQIADIQEKQRVIGLSIVLSGEEDLEKRKKIAQLERERLGLQERLNGQLEREKEKRDDLLKKQAKAKKALAEAEQEAATALRDRSGFTLADAAEGKAGTASERAKARQVLQLEERAKRIRGISDFRDPNGRRVDPNQYADGLISKADGMRKGIDGLTSKEKDPNMNVAKNIKESRDFLEEIKKAHTPKSNTPPKR